MHRTSLKCAAKQPVAAGRALFGQAALERQS